MCADTTAGPSQRVSGTRRHSLRLHGYDYAQAGAYFVTICAWNRECSFGRVADGDVTLNTVGTMVDTVWSELPLHCDGLALDAFVVMPNHLHGIVLLTCAGNGCDGPEGGREGLSLSDCRSTRSEAEQCIALPEVVRRFKTLTTSRFRMGGARSNGPGGRTRLWQRNYYEHVIRDEAGLSRVRQYITENPAAWDMDEENPARRS